MHVYCLVVVLSDSELQQEESSVAHVIFVPEDGEMMQPNSSNVVTQSRQSHRLGVWLGLLTPSTPHGCAGLTMAWRREGARLLYSCTCSYMLLLLMVFLVMWEVVDVLVMVS